MFASLLTALRLVVLTVAVLVAGYTALVLAVAQFAFPDRAAGQLVRRAGLVVGSRLIAQAFADERYVWPRPSAVAHAADASGGSNLPPTDPALAARARARLAELGASPEHRAPVDLVLASGSGLDPHVTLAAARWQAARVARARGISSDAVMALVERVARDDGTWRQGLVNVLLLDLALDDAWPAGIR